MTLRILLVVLALVAALGGAAAPAAAQQGDAFTEASARVDRELRNAVGELDRLREQIAAERIPMAEELASLEAELLTVRREFERTARLLDRRNLDLSTLTQEIEARKDEAAYLSNLLGEYIRNLEARMHITELQRYGEVLEETRLAMENSSLPPQERFAAQATMLERSIARMEDALGGVSFPGTAVGPEGEIQTGSFLLVGPYALFRSDDGAVVGVAEQRIGSLEPTVLPFGEESDRVAAASLIERGSGQLPLDPTLGNAIKVEATEETLAEHIAKGGPVMVPILALAALALLVALFKWVHLSFVRTPSQKKLKGFLAAVANHDRHRAMEQARSIGGPTGLMLARGVEHIHAPRELVEEIMYETVLTTRLKLQKALPFIAICAAAAPLLGLLGTVTGIINTFKLITVFGSGDVKTLSGGISEALITTEYGLITAIPSLLLHAFLSRKAKGVVDGMEKAAVAFVNQLGKTPFGPGSAGQPAGGAPLSDPAPAAPAPPSAAGDGPRKAPPNDNGGYPEVETRPAGSPAAVPAGSGWTGGPDGSERS